MQAFEGREVPHEVRVEEFQDNSENSKKKILDSLFQSNNSVTKAKKEQEEEGTRSVVS